MTGNRLLFPNDFIKPWIVLLSFFQFVSGTFSRSEVHVGLTSSPPFAVLSTGSCVTVEVAVVAVFFPPFFHWLGGVQPTDECTFFSQPLALRMLDLPTPRDLLVWPFPLISPTF